MTSFFQYSGILTLGLTLVILNWSVASWGETPGENPQWRETTVCGVHDGDTLKTCEGQSIRLWGIDAPELKQHHGTLAQQALSKRLLGRSITLHCQGQSYRRNVCTVFEDGEEINAWMVLHGFAYDSPQYSHKHYAINEWLAQTLHLGLWISPLASEAPWQWRRQQHNHFRLIAGQQPTQVFSQLH